MYIFKSFLKVLGVISFRLTVSCLLTSVHIIIKSFFNEKVHMRAACVYPPIIFQCFFSIFDVTFYYSLTAQYSNFASLFFVHRALNLQKTPKLANFLRLI